MKPLTAAAVVAGVLIALLAFVDWAYAAFGRFGVVDRWLSQRVPFFARRWQQRMRAVVVNECRADNKEAAAQLLRAADVFVFDEVGRAELIDAACRYRNCLKAYVRATEGEEGERKLEALWAEQAREAATDGRVPE